MKTSFRARTPGTIEMELTITMEMRYWMRLQEQLERDGSGPSNYPAWKIASAIEDMIKAAKAHWEFERKDVGGVDYNE